MYAISMANEMIVANDTESEIALTVQEAAERMGLSVHTLRYYERAGLLASPVRDISSGHRRYSEEDLRRILFLKRLRTTGMPIREMQRYIALVAEGDTEGEKRAQMLEEHRCQVLRQIAELQDCLAAIEYKIASYRNCDTGKPDKKGVCNDE